MPKSVVRKQGRVSLKDIANYAGVSVGSVSSVLNNRHLERRIPQNTAERIRATAAKLGYLPNISARRLRSSAGAKNSVLLALITSFEAPIPLINHFISALHQEADSGEFSRADYSFSLMIEMFPAGRLREMPGLLTGDHFNAAIILNTVAEDDQFLSRTHLPYPVVLVNRSIAGYTVVVENENCGSRSAEVLARIKRTRLAVLHGSPSTQITRSRVDTFMRRAFELTGRPAVEILADKLSADAAYEAMSKFLNESGPCDGLYTVSDGLAVGAYRAIKEHGLKIPNDVAVVSVDDYGVAPFFDPPLTCVGVSHQQLAELASSLLIKQLVGGIVPRERILASTQEVLRGSTGH